MIEALPPVEQKNYTPLLATKNRLMLYVGTGDSSVLKPTEIVNSEYVETLTPTMEYDINNQTFTIIENASNHERTKQASFEKSKIDQAVNDWAEKNAKVVNKMKGIDAIYGLLGCYPEQVNTNEMVNFYNVYFGGPKNESNIKLFVDDVIRSYYRQDGMDKSKKTLNVNKLKSDLPSIQRLAQAFGDTSGEIITQLIDAEVDLIATQKTELNKVIGEKINDVGTEDKKLLEFLIKDQILEKPKKIPVKTPQPTPPKSPKIIINPNQKLTFTPTRKPTNAEPPKTEQPLVDIEFKIDPDKTTLDNVFDLYVQFSSLSKLTEAKIDENTIRLKTAGITNPIDMEKDDEYKKVSDLNKRILMKKNKTGVLINNLEDIIIPNILGNSYENIIAKPELFFIYESLKNKLVQYVTTSNENVGKLALETEKQLQEFYKKAAQEGIGFANPDLSIEDFLRKHQPMLSKSVKDIQTPSTKAP